MAPQPLTTLSLVQTHLIQLTVERRGDRHKVTNGRKINRDRRDGQGKEKITPPRRPDKAEWMTSLPALGPEDVQQDSGLVRGFRGGRWPALLFHFHCF